MALPILGVNRQGEGTELMEGVRFGDMGNLVLDTGWKSAIQLLVEGGKVVEVNEVLHDVLVIMHLEVFKVGLGLTLRIVGSEVIF